MLFVEVGGQLSDRHAVTHGQGIEADEGRERGVRHGALDEHAAERVGPVEHDDPHPDPRARAHGERHGPGERVVAGADVLEVHDERVDSPQHGRRGLAARAIEAPHRQARGGIVGPCDSGVILRRAPQPMLRRQECQDFHRSQMAQEGGGVLVAPVDRRLMREQRDPLPTQERRTAADEHVEPRFDGRHHVR